MDWPTASVILGVLGAISVAVIKLVPSRATNGPSAEIKVLRAHNQNLVRSIDELRKEFHQLRELVKDWMLSMKKG